jgi:BioD-like phosphotransacetylase family protein
MTKQAIYVASTEEFSGKSVITIALSLIAKDLGEKVGYFKPIGLESAMSEKGEPLDEDAETMKRILDLKADSNIICPTVLRRDTFLDEFKEKDIPKSVRKIASSYRKLSEDNDIMLIEGASTLSMGSFMNCPTPKLAKNLGAKVLLVERFEDDSVVDNILQARDYCSKWRVPLLGVVLNRVLQRKVEKARQVIKPFLEKNGIQVLGIIQEDVAVSALTVGEVHEIVGGRILAGKDGMDRTVQTVLIGAMTPESAIRYFRKAKNELVITGGDRTDIIFAALEAGVSALILTGNLYPSVKIFPRADDLEVPVILVPYDTYTTLQLVQRIVGRIKPTDRKRIGRVKKLVKENVDWKQILENPITSE